MELPPDHPNYRVGVLRLQTGRLNSGCSAPSAPSEDMEIPRSRMPLTTRRRDDPALARSADRDRLAAQIRVIALGPAHGSADQWRILVGPDAHKIDKLVRRSPGRAYDVDFFEQFAREVGWPCLPDIAPHCSPPPAER